MKLADINAIAGVLAGVKINKIADRAAKDGISKTFLAVRKALRPFERDRAELVGKFRSDWKDEITAELAKKDFDRADYDRAMADLNDTIAKMLNEGESDIAFSPVKSDHLYAPDLWGENITLGEIEEVVAFLIQHGVAEE